MVLPSWRHLGLAFFLCVALSAGEAAESTLLVFSSLQKSDAYQMPPYPAGTTLSLTCQTAGNRATYWYENATTNPVKLPSESNDANGVQWSVYIKRLEGSDHGRTLTCMKDASTMREDVNLNIVGPPSQADITSSFDAKVQAVLKCNAEGLSSQLELCWYRGKEKLLCQAPDGGASPSTRTTVTVQVDLPEILGEPRTYLCKPQLRPNISIDSLTDATLQHFDDMFATVSKELRMVPQGLVDCSASQSPGEDTDEKKIIVGKSENENTSCYELVVTEHAVPPSSSHKPPKSSKSTNKLSTTSKPGSISDPIKAADQTPHSVGKGSSSARAGPHQLAVLLLLALAVVQCTLG